ncbi:MAG: DUF2125 domain-containing protein [Rhodospirillales bacterium]|jgi:hypothetical protein|nr:DUF2125 domain-containing protein [Rhodospirillales bacterium]
MNRSAPLDAQDAQAVLEAARGEAPSSSPLQRMAGLAAAIATLLLLAYSAWWGFTALQLRAGVLDWMAARQSEGYRVAYSRIGVGGFPTIARVTVKAPTIAAPDGRALSWSWVGRKAVIELDPFRLDSLDLRLLGDDIVSINIDGKLRTYRGAAEELTLRLRGGSGPGGGAVTVRNLAMAAEEPGDAVEIADLRASAEPSLQSSTAAADGAYAVAIEAAGVRLPQQFDLPLGALVSHLSAQATVVGAFSAAGDLPAALARWRESGGTAEVSHLGLRYGPLVVDGSGTASLDTDMQPVGTFMVRLEGIQPTLSALAARGFIDEQAAARAKLALSLLSRPGAGGAPSLSVPVSLHDRRLSVGPLPLMVVPPIEWPRGPSPRTDAISPLAGAAAG